MIFKRNINIWQGSGMKYVDSTNVNLGERT